MALIKICGLFRECDITYANIARPDYIGFILNVPKSHRNVSIEQACELRKQLAGDIQAVGVFVNEKTDVIVDAVKKIPLDVIQLHGNETNSDILELKQMVTIPVWKAFKVRGKNDLIAAYECVADGVLLDGGSGDGVVFDWSLLKGFGRPFILAGGLRPETIKDALATGANIVDVSSGVESDRIKDLAKMKAAVTAARGGII